MTGEVERAAGRTSEHFWDAKDGKGEEMASSLVSESKLEQKAYMGAQSSEDVVQSADVDSDAFATCPARDVTRRDLTY